MHAQLGNWDDLRFFLSVARHGKLSAAADELEVNHSTVFRRIAALEDRLGTRLFDRHANGHELTSAGEEMREVATRVEEEVLNLDRAVLGRDHQLAGLVRVTTADIGSAFAAYFHGFLAAYPGVELELVIDNRMLSLTRREADVAIRPGKRPTSEPDVVARHIGKVRFGVYAAPSYVARAGTPTTHAELSQHDIVTADHTLAHMPSARWLAEHAQGARVRVRANSVSSQLAAVRSGIGIGALPCIAAGDEPGLVRLFSSEAMPSHDLWLLYHGDLRQTCRVRAFIDYIAEAVSADHARF